MGGYFFSSFYVRTKDNNRLQAERSSCFSKTNLKMKTNIGIFELCDMMKYTISFLLQTMYVCLVVTIFSGLLFRINLKTMPNDCTCKFFSVFSIYLVWRFSFFFFFFFFGGGGGGGGGIPSMCHLSNDTFQRDLSTYIRKKFRKKMLHIDFPPPPPPLTLTAL